MNPQQHQQLINAFGILNATIIKSMGVANNPYINAQVFLRQSETFHGGDTEKEKKERDKGNANAREMGGAVERAIKAPMLAIVAKIAGSVAPLAIATSAISSKSSGFSALGTALQILGESLGVFLLPITMELGVAMLMAADYVKKNFMGAAKDFAAWVQGAAGKVVENVAEVANEAGEAHGNFQFGLGKIVEQGKNLVDLAVAAATGNESRKQAAKENVDGGFFKAVLKTAVQFAGQPTVAEALFPSPKMAPPPKPWEAGWQGGLDIVQPKEEINAQDAAKAIALKLIAPGGLGGIADVLGAAKQPETREEKLRKIFADSVKFGLSGGQASYVSSSRDIRRQAQLSVQGDPLQKLLEQNRQELIKVVDEIAQGKEHVKISNELLRKLVQNWGLA